MTRNEFIEKINNGYDIMLDVLDKHLTILTWTEKGIFIGEQNKEGDEMYFTSAEELADKYLVNGTPIGLLSDNVIITDYT